ncbi:MAG: hypothetical protein E7477_08355 [Ruminococcaceae bacterium]|nr:hypothetical protein [Oscillospiraceae bacterium]
MKKIIALTILFLLCFSFTSCDNDSKKMNGFTYDELAEYLSEIDGLTPLDRRDEPLYLPCKDNTLTLVNTIKSLNSSMSGRFYSGVLLHKLFKIEVPSKVPELYPTIFTPIYGEDFFDKQDSYITQKAPENFAYILRDFNVKCSPEWTEWIDYNIPVIDGYQAKHGLLDACWYNPLTEQFESSVYYSQLEDSTELYVVFQKTTLFYSAAYRLPFLMSEEAYEYLKSTYKKFHYDHYTKGTVEDFTNWFFSEDSEDFSDVFADIRAEYIYYPIKGSGIYENLKDESFDSVSFFISDLEKLGVNFDALKTYIIKATFPHGGTIEDIYWELIG